MTLGGTLMLGSVELSTQKGGGSSPISKFADISTTILKILNCNLRQSVLAGEVHLNVSEDCFHFFFFFFFLPPFLKKKSILLCNPV